MKKILKKNSGYYEETGLYSTKTECSLRCGKSLCELKIISRPTYLNILFRQSWGKGYRLSPKITFMSKAIS